MQIFQTISDKNYAKNYCLEKSFQRFIGSEGKFDMLFLKFPYFVTDSLKFTKTKKEGVRCMLFQITQIYFNKCAYATLHSAMRITTESGAKTTQKLSQKLF